MKTPLNLNDAASREPLALVGIGCRLPGGVRDAESFWKMLIEGRSGITEVPADRWNSDRFYHPDATIPGRMISKWGGFVDHLKSFDAPFWGISPREATRMDPQQRWLLEAAWEALEDAGTAPSKLRQANIGVFVGIASNDYGSLQLSDYSNADVHTNSGGTLSIAANRVSYLLDLKGPSVSVDTACSSALVAISLACKAIWSGDCDAALAGGVNALITPHASIGFSKATMLSPSGKCYAFDDRADGYVRSEGAGLIYLKPLSQAIENRDPIYAVIRAAVVNQDGHTSSMTVPGVESQSAMLRIAYRDAGIPASQVAYVEAHGTGTPVGDPIETTALGNVLAQGRAEGETCLIGSVKTNIGHLESGSGIAGLIKAALVLHRDMVPPSLNFKTPNPNIPFEKLKLEVADRLRPLPHANGKPPVAAVNSFGFGGTNAHVVLQAAPAREVAARPKQVDRDRPFVLPISARDDVALRDYAKAYRSSLEDESLDLADFCYSAGARKEHHSERLVVLGRDAKELRGRLDSWLRGGDAAEGVITGRGAAKSKPIVFVFTGQGAQWWGMGRELLEREPIVRQTIEKIDALFQKISGWSIVEEMTRPEAESNINQTAIAQPAIFALQVALAELWQSWGIKPARVIGHSVGEAAAAYCAGVFSLEDAVQLIYHRSRLQDTTAGHGKMLAAGITAAEARTAIGDLAAQVQLAAINSPNLVTLAGDTAPLETIAAKLEAEGRFVRWLRVNYAFHTHQMESIKDELLEALAGIQPQPARIPFVSTVTGEVHPGERLDAMYWWHNVRQPVLFGPAIDSLIESGEGLFLEIGPHPALQSSITACFAERGSKGAIYHSLARNTDESLEMLTNLAGLHLASAEIDWAALNQSGGNFVRLPRYPWHYETYWLDIGHMAERLLPTMHPLLGKRLSAAKPTWQFELDPRLFPYLDDHRIWDGIVFPAAGYGEIGFAVADELFPDEPYVVEELEATRALFVSEDAVPTVQVVFDPTDKSFGIYSSTGDKEWELNARGRLVLCPADTTAPTNTNLAATRSLLAGHVTHETYYGELHAMGYGFGPCFSEIQQIWLNPGESLAEIVVPEDLTNESGQYHFHPAVLDACFQATLGSGDVSVESSAPEFFYLPESIRRIQVYRKELPARLWAHARRRSADGKSIVSDIFVYDDQGVRFADILGFRVAKVEHKRGGDDVENCLYQFRWEPRRLRGTGVEGSCAFPTSKNFVGDVRKQAASVYDEFELVDYYKRFAPRMERIVQQYIQNACVQLGWDFEVGDRFDFAAFIDKLGIVAEHHRLAKAELGWLEADGLLKRSGDEWQVLRLPKEDTTERLTALAEELPRFASEAALIQATGPRLAEVLSGQVDPLELLFPGGSNELLENFYIQGGDFPAFNRLIQVAVSKAAESLPPRRAIRVMEVGAGTGSLTRDILEVLPADNCEYLFTDIGPAFVAAAKKQFAGHACMEYQTFDVERDPQAQNIPLHGYDLILATNVLHATQDLGQTLATLRSCLAPGGVLMFLEVVRRRPVWDNLFGLLKGWWRYTDEDLRTDSPLLERTQWETLLKQSGFRDVQSFICSSDDEETEQSAFVAFGPDVIDETDETEGEPQSSDAEAAASEPPYIVFCDEQGTADALIDRLSQRGNSVIQLRRGSKFRQVSATEFTLADGSTDELLKVFKSETIPEHGAKAIVHCWSLDNEAVTNLKPDALIHAQQNGVLSGLNLAHVFAKLELPLAPRVHFVTRGAYAVAKGDSVAGIAASPLIGFSRVANNESYENHWTLIDLDEQRGEFEVDDLCDEILIGDNEHEIAFRNNRRHVNRLQRVRLEDLPDRSQNAVQADGSVLPYRLQTRKPGTLANLTLNETPRRDLGPNEIEVRVRAGGINFRDLMKALGMYPGNPVDLLWFGDDFCGTIERVGSEVRDLKPGDDVAGMAPYAFRSHLTVDHRMTFKRPTGMSFEESATLPTVFLTSHFALKHLARMERGEKILIHAGTGGVGQAAIQIAQSLGLEIFSTAGTPQKRQMLTDMGVPHVMNSRTLEFADQIMEITNGRGVDAVLNSLAGEFVPKSLSVLAPFGRFLEIGKIDVYGNTKLGLASLKENISYYVIDLAQVLTEKPECVAGMYRDLTERFASGEYGPLPHKVFPITDFVEAFRYMAQGKHVGKNVLSFEQDNIPISPCSEEGHLLRADASYLITGGAGGFGLEIAKWMAAQGARHLVLMSRSGPREDAAADIAKLQAEGVSVVDARGDVTSPEDVQRVVDQIQTECPPLKGVVHGAMVLDDEFMTDLDEERFNRVLHPKMVGAWNLHVATRDLPLEHFISFSSISAVFGATKQSNYSAGNCFLDALALHRHALGLPSMTLNWGAILGAGFVERNRKTAEYLDKIGLKPLHVEEAVKALGELIQKAAPLVAVGRVDWKQLGKLSAAVANLPMYAPVAQETTQNRSGVSLRPRLMAASPSERVALVEDFLTEQVAGVFGIDSAKVDRNTSLTNLGLDSLMAVELMNRVEAELGMNIPMGGVLSGPNVKELTQTVLGLIVESTDADEAVGEETSRASGGLIPLESLDVQLDKFPLTIRQRVLWSECQRRSSAHGNVACAAIVRPQVDADKLRAACRSICDRHAMLRASIAKVDDDWIQRVRSGGEIELQEVDATQSDAQPLSKLIATRINRPFDLDSGPLARIELLRRDDASDVILLCAHPVIADAWSTTVLFRDLIEAYRAECLGETVTAELPELSYEDFARWEDNLLSNDASGRMLDYWVEQLDGAPLEVNLPSDRSRGLVQTHHGSSFQLQLDDELTLQLLALSAEQNVPLRVTLFAAFTLLLHQRSNQNDLLVGFRFDGRNQPELSDTVGQFENWLPTRSRMEGEQSFCDFLAETRQRLASGEENQQVPVSRLLDRLDFDRPEAEHETTGKSLVQVAFAMPQSGSADDNAYALFQIGRGGHALNLGSLSIETIDALVGENSPGAKSQQAAKRNGSASRMESDLALELGESCGRVLGWWHYNSELFDAATIAQLNADYSLILRQVVANPTRSVSQLFPATIETAQASDLRRVKLRSIAHVDDIDFEMEYQLDPSITPSGPPVVRKNGSSRRFLTGATGFIGAYLLSELLERTDSEIVCLVRAKDEADGLRRIHENLAAYELSPPGIEDRVRVVIGDFSKPLFGLTQEEFDRLASEIDVIYHNGADVNLVLPYESLRAVNVYGTREVLRLACHLHTKPTHVVSTFTVHTTNATRGQVVTETDPLPPCEELLHGYSQTKWVSEKMIGIARERGLPVAIYRPGHVTGDSRTGAANTNDLLHTFSLVCVRLGMAPLRDVEMDVTPVDYVSQAIAELSLHPESLGKNFHLTNPEPLQAPVLVEWMEDFEIGIQRVPYDVWRDRVFALADQMNSPELKLLGDILGPRVLSDDQAIAVHPRFDSRVASTALENTGIQCAPANRQLLITYSEYLQRMGAMPAPATDQAGKK
jgi:thioester reductase-like protein